MTKTVLITGGGSGIGRELVKLFIADGYSIIVFSLLEAELSDLKKELIALQYHEDQFTLVPFDLAQVNAAQNVFTWCENNDRTIDVLVNNAGFAISGEHVDQNINTLHTMLTLNMATVAELSLLFRQKMKQRGSGKILNIGSTTGISPVPLSAAYSASKAFINSLTVSLHVELAPYGIQVSCMEPYLTKTKFLSTCHEVSEKDSKETVDIKKQEKTGHSAARVASYAYQGLKANKAIILPGRLFHVLAFIMRVLPQTFIAKQLYKLTHSQS